MELAPRGIRVNVVAAGAPPPPGLAGRLGGAAPPPTTASAVPRKPSVGSSPLGRNSRLDEVAAAALFLASDESSFVNGSELFADGGAAQI